MSSPEPSSTTRIAVGSPQTSGGISRITSPTLVITADRSALQTVEAVLQYQKKIKNSRLLVLQSDAYHVAVAKADECVTNVLTFIKETKA